MIYFDNSATTLQKPPEVAQQTAWAIHHLGNAGRSFYQPAMLAARTVFAARQEIATLVGLQNPLQVAFTSSATEALNLVTMGLVTAADHVITTEAEHNSVLRPLYLSGCELSFIPYGENGELLLSQLENLLRPNTKAVFCAHGSNLLGSIANVEKIQAFCKKHSLVLVLDVAQTLGQIPVQGGMANLLCFAGHKSLFGPQGTGGVIAGQTPALRIVKTGGTGTASFAATQPAQMPDIFEAGTANSHALCGLQQGVKFVNRIGVPAIERKDRELTEQFLQGLHAIPAIRLYGSHSATGRLPVVALNVGDYSSEETSLMLWEQYEIATRPGIHCAPLVHRHFGTDARGMVRFSFSYFNTAKEVDTALAALRQIAKNGGA